MDSTVRIRTIENCVKEIKKIEPETAISEWFVRCLCKEGKVKHFKTGTKFLVNFDHLLYYLNYGYEQNNKDGTANQ